MEYIEVSDGDDTEPLVGCKRYTASYGSSFDEISSYVDKLDLVKHIRYLEYTSPRPLKTKKGELEPLVAIMNARNRHFVALGIDFSNKTYAVMGARQITPRLFGNWAKSSQIELENMIDRSPAVESQDESECGARVVVFAEWFLRERDAKGKSRPSIDNFYDRVAKLMTHWRSERAKLKKQDEQQKRKKAKTDGKVI